MPRQVVVLLALFLPIGCDASRPSSQSSAQASPATTAARIPGQAENTPLPAVSLPDLAGTLRPLRAGAGEVTVINFWATWCVPCLKELPDLVALDQQWSERGVRVVGIAIDSGDPADIRAFAKEHGMDYTLLMADQQWARKHFGVFGLPVTLVVDREGNIRRRMIGPQTGAQFEAAAQAFLGT